MKRRLILTAAATAVAGPAGLLTFQARAADGDRPKFRRVPTQYIAALGEPGANSGSNAQTWGLWPLDPGPRGVKLSQFAQLQKAEGVAPDGWKFDSKDWWLEEHGLIMEQPQFPVVAGTFLVTGLRSVTTSLTIDPADKSGVQRWRLGDGASLYDVTHLGCRAARYTPKSGAGTCSPINAPRATFPVDEGAAMPAVAGCAQQDYAVLIVIGIAPKS